VARIHAQLKRVMNVVALALGAQLPFEFFAAPR
jgi:hypothetical protein